MPPEFYDPTYCDPIPEPQLVRDYPDSEPCRLPIVAQVMQLPPAVSLNVVLFRINYLMRHVRALDESN